MLQEDSPTQATAALAPVVAKDERQPKEKKETRKKSANAQTSLNPQPNDGEIKIDQTSQSEVIVTIQLQEQSKTLTHEESQETMNTTANPKCKILAIDGGGIRGIIPALILAEIEKRTQKPVFSLFDLIAGTSSREILALGLTKPRLTSGLSENLSVAQYSAEELVQIFFEY